MNSTSDAQGSFTKREVIEILGANPEIVSKLIKNGDLTQTGGKELDSIISAVSLENYIAKNNLGEYGIAIGVKQIMGETLFARQHIADIIGVSPRTVGKLFDSNKIKGYKYFDDRRIPRKCLEEYIQNEKLGEHGIAIGFSQELGKTLFTSNDVGERLGVSDRTARKLIDSKEIKGFKINADRRVSKDNLQEYIIKKGLDKHGIDADIIQDNAWQISTGILHKMLKLSSEKVAKLLKSKIIPTYSFSPAAKDDTENLHKKVYVGNILTAAQDHPELFEGAEIPKVTLSVKNPVILYHGENHDFIKQLSKTFDVKHITTILDTDSHAYAAHPPLAIIIDGNVSALGQTEREAMMESLKGDQETHFIRKPAIYALTADDLSYDATRQETLGLSGSFQGPEGYEELKAALKTLKNSIARK